MFVKRFNVGDILEMKKNHPCGGKKMRVVRTGSDIRVACINCGRDMLVPRIKLERNIRKIMTVSDKEQ